MYLTQNCGHSALCVLGVAVLAIVSGNAAKALAVVSGSAVYDPYSNANLYIVGSNSTTWTQAESLAVGMGGKLVTVHSAAEDQFITSAMFSNFSASGGPNLSNGYALWTGLYDPTGLQSNDGHGTQHAADFAWVDGETATYRNWNAGEPNNGYYLGSQGPYEDYSSMYGPGATGVNESNGGSAAPAGTWNDLPNNYAIPNLGTTGFYGIAEVPVPEPTSSALFVAASVAQLRRTRRYRSHLH